MELALKWVGERGHNSRAKVLCNAADGPKGAYRSPIGCAVLGLCRPFPTGMAFAVFQALGRGAFRNGASRQQGFGLVMKHKNSHLLVGYWSRLRTGRDVPTQSVIDPRAIKRLLSYVFILDCENPARPIYRLAGTGLCERFGFELKGTSFLAHWEAQSGLSLASLLRQALKAGQPLCLSSIAATADNGMVELETILTPVSLNGGAPTRFFGLVQMLSDPAPLLGRSI